MLKGNKVKNFSLVDYRKKDYKVYIIVVLVILVVYTLSVLFLLFWGFSTSLKSRAEFRSNLLGLPKHWEFSNYVKVFQEIYVTVDNGTKNIYVPQLMINAIIIACVNAFIPGWVNIVVAYLTVRFSHIKFNKFIINTTIIMMLIPIGAPLSVQLSFRKSIGLYDNLFLNLIPGMGWGGTGLFIYRSLFAGTGKSYCEAASIDGANEFTIMTRIMFPFILPMFMSFSLMGIIGAWGDYTQTLVWLPSMPTIGYALFNFSSSSATSLSNPTMQISACMLVMLPMLILFIIFGNYFMKNINVGGLKG